MRAPRKKRTRLADAARSARYAGCMNAMQKLIYAGFAAAALASASMPVFSSAEYVAPTDEFSASPARAPDSNRR